MERAGLKILDKKIPTLDPEATRKVLKRMVNGRLHYFDEEQKQAMDKVMWGFLKWSVLIGFISTAISTPAEVRPPVHNSKCSIAYPPSQELKFCSLPVSLGVAEHFVLVVPD